MRDPNADKTRGFNLAELLRNLKLGRVAESAPKPQKRSKKHRKFEKEYAYGHKRSKLPRPVAPIRFTRAK